MSRPLSTDLFDLVKSLTKAEKRQFKLYTSRRGSNGTSKYIQLFDALDRMERYDEAALTEHNPTLQTSDLKSLKPYLYDLILRSLRDTLKDRLSIAEMRYQLDKVAILIEKALYTQASRLLERLKQTAQEEENLTALIEILELEDSLRVRCEKVNSPEHHQQIHQQVIETIAKLQRKTEYRDLMAQQYYLYRDMVVAHSDKELSKLDQLMNHPLLKDISQATTFLAKARFLEIHFFDAFLRKEETKAYNRAQTHIELFNAHPVHRKKHLYLYAYAIGGFLVQCMISKREEEFDKYYSILEELEENCRKHPDWIDIALNRPICPSSSTSVPIVDLNRSTQ